MIVTGGRGRGGGGGGRGHCLIEGSYPLVNDRACFSGLSPPLPIYFCFFLCPDPFILSISILIRVGVAYRPL